MQFPNLKFVRQQRKQWLWMALLSAVVGVSLVVSLYQQRQTTLERERDRLLVQARVVDSNLAQQFKGANAALVSLRNDIKFLHDTGMDSHGVGRLQALSAAMPGVRTLLITDELGHVVSCNRTEVMNMRLGKRRYFQLAQANPAIEKLFVSEPFETLLKVYSLNLVKVLQDDTGGFGGIVSATLDPDYFQVLMRSVVYSADMRTTLVHGAGKVVLIEPPDRSALGRNLSVPTTFLAQHQLSGQTESFWEGSDDISGEARLIAIRTVWPVSLQMDQPLFVMASREVAAVLAPWRQLSTILGLSFLLLTILAAGGLLVFQRKQLALLALQALRDQEDADHTERMDLALKGGDLGLWDIDLVSGARNVNGRALAMVGDADGSGTGTLEDWFARIHPDDLPGAHAARFAHQEGRTDAMVMEYRVRHTDGHWVHIHSRGKVTHHSESGEPQRMIGTYLDITERKAAEAQIAELAFHDALTKLPNRRLLMDRLAQAQSASARSRSMAAVMFLDLDRFKWVNDTLGHDLGDSLLQQVAARLLTCVRQTDTVARLGGDEFVLVLEDLGASQSDAMVRAQALADKVLQALSQPMALGDTEHTVTTSIGVALFCANTPSSVQVLKQADEAMYRAKAAGRNGVSIWLTANDDAPALSGQQIRPKTYGFTESKSPSQDASG